MFIFGLHFPERSTALMMSALVIVVETSLCFVTVGLLLSHYGDLKRQNRISSFATFVSWASSFLILFLLPVDIASTFYRRCLSRHHLNTSTIDLATGSSTRPDRYSDRPLGQLISNDNDTYHFFSEANTTECVKPRVFVEDPVLQVLWHFIYWSGQILTWVALPVIQSYALSGEFSSMKKMKSVEQGARRRYRIGVYFRVDPSELEGVKLRSQRLTNREDSPLRCAAYRNARSKNYGSARIQASRPLLDA